MKKQRRTGRILGLLLAVLMCVSLLPASMVTVQAANTMTIKVTKNADTSNPTVVGVYQRPTRYFVEKVSYPVTKTGTEGEYDIYTASPETSGLLIVEAHIPGSTNKVAKTVDAGSAVTLDLVQQASWSVNGKYSDDMYTNLDDSGTLNLAVGGEFALDTFRVWQALGSSVTENVFTEPEFVFEVFGDSIDTARIGKAGREQLKITAQKAGVSVIKITYGPVSFNNLEYSAIDPRNTYAVMVNVGGGPGFDTGINTEGGVQVRNDFDTFYFDKTKGSHDFTFTPAEGSIVRVHEPLNISTWGEGWSVGTKEGNEWTVPLKDGRNIIEIKNDDSTRYHLVKARGVTVTVANISSPDQPIAVGETARITIRGIEAPIAKMAGVYNPGFTTKPYLRYTAGATSVKSDASGQYEVLQKTFVVDYTLNSKDESILNGDIQGGGGFWGVGMSIGEHRKLPLEGVGSSIGAAPDMGALFFGSLPEIELEVDETRSTVSAFTEDGWIIVECTGGTKADDALLRILKDKVGESNLDSITKLKITGTMTNWDFYNGTAVTSQGALHGSSNGGAVATALLPNLIELDLSEIEGVDGNGVVFPNQALRYLPMLEKLRLPEDFIVTVTAGGVTSPGHLTYRLPALRTVVFGNGPYVEGVIDMTGFTGSEFPANIFNSLDESVASPLPAKIVTTGHLGVSQRLFSGVKNLQEIIFTGDTLGTINSTSPFNSGIKNTAIAYVPNGADTTDLEKYINAANIKQISDYPADAELETAKTELTSAISRFKTAYSTNPGYSDHIWGTFEKAISDAETLLTYENYRLTVAALAGAESSIEEIIGAFVPDKTALKNAIGEANDFAENDWTESSWAVFRSALENARTAYYDNDAELSEVTTACANLIAAIDGLEEPLGNKEWLQTQIDLYGNARRSDFTADSQWGAFSTAMTNAKAVYAASGATVKEVNAVEEELNNALNNVVYIGDLRSEITNAKSLDEAGYTPDTWSVLASALDAAETVYEKANATKTEVDTAVFALRQAAMDLESTGVTPPAKSVTVTFRLIGDTVHDNFESHEKYVTWMATKSYTFNNVDRITVYDLFTRALDEAGLGYRGADRNYVSAIQAPAVLGGFWLSEFDNGPNSGWMYTVDGDHPGRGLQTEYLTNGNAVIWHYVDDFTKETSFEGSIPTHPNRWLEADDVNPDANPDPSAQLKQTINVNGNTSNGTTAVTVSNSSITNALNLVKEQLEKPANTNATGEVVLDVVSTSATNTIEISIGASSIQAIANAQKVVLTVDSDFATITFDSQTLAGISSGVSANTVITISIEKVKSDSLTKEQAAIVGANPAFNLSLSVGGTEVHNFAGKATVFIPYTLKASETANTLAVYHLDDDGKLTELKNAQYNTGKQGFEFETTHFSIFMIARKGLTDIVEWENPFKDVADSDWFYDAVEYAFINGLMNGTAADRFEPATNLTRAMFVTILYRYEDEPTSTAVNKFKDVPSGQWYTNAIIWANENKIVEGYGDELFGTNDSITREQAATLLMRYAKYKNLNVSKTTSITAYADAAEVSSWALEAMKWANAEGLITGRTTTTLVPKGTMTRAEVATLLMRFIEDFVK